METIEFVNDTLKLRGGQIGILGLRNDDIMDRAIKTAIVQLSNIDQSSNSSDLMLFFEWMKEKYPSIMDTYSNTDLDYHFTNEYLQKAIKISEEKQEKVNADPNTKFYEENLAYTYSLTDGWKDMLKEAGLFTEVGMHLQKNITKQNVQEHTPPEPVETNRNVKTDFSNEMPITTSEKEQFLKDKYGADNVKLETKKTNFDAETPVSSDEWLEDFNNRYGYAEKNIYGERTIVAKNIDDVTQPSLPRNSNPNGDYAIPDPNDPRAIMRQNESADFLSQQGFDVKMLKEIPGGNGYGKTQNKNPDYLIESKVFDNFAPDKSSIMKIVDTIRSKVKVQSERVVLNLNDVSTSPESIVDYLEKHPLPALKELIIIKNESYIQYIP